MGGFAMNRKMIMAMLVIVLASIFLSFFSFENWFSSITEKKKTVVKKKDVLLQPKAHKDDMHNIGFKKGESNSPLINEYSMELVSEIIFDILHDNISKYEFDFIFAAVYGNDKSIEIPSEQFDDFLFNKILLLTYLGLFDKQKSLEFFDTLLTDEGLNKFKLDLKGEKAFTEYSRDEFKALVMVSVLEGYAFIHTSESRKRLESMLSAPEKFKDEKNIPLNDQIMTGVISSLAYSDALDDLGEKRFFQKFHTPGHPNFIFPYLEKYDNNGDSAEFYVYDSVK